MSKIKLTDLAKKLGIPYETLFNLRNEKLSPSDWTGTGKNTWLTANAAERLELATKVPLAVPTLLNGYAVRDAPNPNYIYAKLDGIEGVKPVVIPRRLYGRLRGKNIQVHAITDTNGTTYRHASLTGHNH